VQVEPGRPALRITDLKSTNGTFLNGRRIAASAYLAPGGTLGIGEHVFRHDFLAPERAILAAYEDAERLHSVSAWLPDPLTRGPLRTATCYRPATPANGAGVAVLPLPDERCALVLIDVCGQGELVERHAARVLRELRDRRDITGPARLLQQLNQRWRMEEHDGLFFTAWAAVYDAATRRLTHACAGQHPALLRDPEGEVHRLDALNPPIGLLPDADFIEETLTVAPASRLYAFNRGAFEFVDRQGRQWELDDFEALLACTPADRDLGEVYEDTMRLRAEDALRDDFLVLRAACL
jgi:serine phosphatase RsbU (regulator of sigma subunit)